MGSASSKPVMLSNCLHKGASHSASLNKTSTFKCLDQCYSLDGYSMDRSRASVRTASAGPRPERRVWIDSPLPPVSVRDRPRQNDSASLFGSQPRCFLDGLTAAEALIRGRQVFQLHQSRWCIGVRIRHVGRPTRELAFQVSPTPFVCCPLLSFFSWPGGGWVTVDLLECAVDGGEASLFRGSERL